MSALTFIVWTKNSNILPTEASQSLRFERVCEVSMSVILCSVCSSHRLRVAVAQLQRSDGWMHYCPPDAGSGTMSSGNTDKKGWTDERETSICMLKHSLTDTWLSLVWLSVNWSFGFGMIINRGTFIKIQILTACRCWGSESCSNRFNCYWIESILIWIIE